MPATLTETNLLRAVPLSAENFRAFGDVIEKAPGTRIGMNNDRFERFKDLARVDVGAEGGRTCISISRCSVATALPYRFDLVERHPLGSQAFIPLGKFQ